MLKRRSSLVVLTMLIGCGSGGGDGAGVLEDDFKVGASTDIQVVSAAASSNTVDIDPLKCVLSSKVNHPMGSFTGSAQADCTAAAAARLSLPMLNAYIEPLMWIRENPKLSSASSRHWCTAAEVVVAVKASVVDGPKFKGMGFYAYDAVLDTPPARRMMFYGKSDKRLVRVGEGSLKNEADAKVYLYKFGGAGPCEVNGTGDNPTHAFLFKPFVRYGNLERWESVPADHGLHYNQRWDRSNDLLK